MSTLQTKKSKTGIPVMKAASRNDGEAHSRPQTSQSDSHQNRVNQQTVQQKVEKEQLLQLHNLQPPQFPLQSLPPQQTLLQAKSKRPFNKKHYPETWADEVIQSQSQKLRPYSLSESKRRQEDMEKHLKEVEVQLVTMGNLLEQREKVMKEAAKESAQKTEQLEQKLHTQECHLIKHSIDPVTGEQIMLDEEGEKKVESNKKFTKKKVQEMRMKLKQMNNQAESYLADIENALQDLTNLELASERAGQLSEGYLKQFADQDEIIRLSEHYDKLTSSGMAFITSLAPDENEIQNENLDINFDASEGDALFKRLAEQMKNGGDTTTIQDEV